MRMRNGTREASMSYLRDWRPTSRALHVYRMANNSFRVQNLIFLFFGSLILFLVYLLLLSIISPPNKAECRYYEYNRTYPISAPIKTSKGGMIYRIAIVSDLDHSSKLPDKKDTWHSIMKTGRIYWDRKTKFMSVIWQDTVVLTSSLSMKGRGMELSELVTFDGRLLSFDDRTGTIYSIEDNQVYPWIILMDGNGRNNKGFKSEWATVKDERLYIGSMGKEWTTPSGEFQHNNPLWVKVVSPQGEVQSLNWMSYYNRLRQAIDINYPGYMIHESGVWSDVHKSWFFLPRRCSHERYNETKDEIMSCNVMLIADENFFNIKVVHVGELVAVRGFSSFKFLPDSRDSIIVALKTEEYQGRTSTYIMAFSIEGTIIMPETKVMDKKFEGLEFI